MLSFLGTVLLIIGGCFAAVIVLFLVFLLGDTIESQGWKNNMDMSSPPSISKKDAYNYLKKNKIGNPEVMRSFYNIDK